MLSYSIDEKPDVTVIAYGYTASLAAESAANLFMEEELLVDVLIPSRLRPVPIDDFYRQSRVQGVLWWWRKGT